ncbi:hypothetical protein CAPTEDRAFT_57683, partial [Capitella teleta]
SGGWVAEVEDANQWIMVDMQEPYNYHKMLVQGRQDSAMWVDTFAIYSSQDGVTFTGYTDENGTDTAGDQDTIQTIELIPPVYGRYIRINPLTWTGGISLRLDF